MKRNLSILGALVITIALALQSGTALADGTDHFGPFASTSPDNGCSGPWALEWLIHNNRPTESW